MDTAKSLNLKEFLGIKPFQDSNNEKLHGEEVVILLKIPSSPWPLVDYHSLSGKGQLLIQSKIEDRNEQTPYCPKVKGSAKRG